MAPSRLPCARAAACPTTPATSSPARGSRHPPATPTAAPTPNSRGSHGPAASAYPPTFTQQWEKRQDLRYGENPHQSGAFYRDLAPAPGSLANYRQLQGTALSS